MLKPRISRDFLKKIPRTSKAVVSKEFLKRIPWMLRASIARALLSIRRSLRLLKVITAREFLNNLLNLRFIMGLVLCVVITVACMTILAHDYRQELDDYSDRVNMQDEFLNNYATHGALFWTNRHPKPPERFRPLIVGIARDNALASFDANPFPILFPYLDFLFVVTLVMSLLALLFSYDAVTGERQRGTLRQALSNSISRTAILLGKFIGGTASLLIPFILALLVGVLYINLDPTIQWDGSAWAELGLLTAASATFITLFYLLGLMVSTLSRYSAVSILNCLFLWVLLILVIPNIAPYISAQIHRLPSIKETERRNQEIERQSLIRAGQVEKDVLEEFRSKYGKLFADWESMEFGGVVGDVGPDYREAAQQRATIDPEFKAMIDAFRDERSQATESVWQARYEEERLLWADLKTRAARQTKLAKNLACISPLANFVYVARDLTGTGLRALKHFDEVDGEYRDRVWQYAGQKLQEGRAKDPTFDRESFIDLSNRPRFVFQEEVLRDKLGAVLPYWGILVAFNVLFFVAAFAGFMRYDVR